MKFWPNFRCFWRFFPRDGVRRILKLPNYSNYTRIHNSWKFCENWLGSFWERTVNKKIIEKKKNVAKHNRLRCYARLPIKRLHTLIYLDFTMGSSTMDFPIHWEEEFHQGLPFWEVPLWTSPLGRGVPPWISPLRRKVPPLFPLGLSILGKFLQRASPCRVSMASNYRLAFIRKKHRSIIYK